MLGGLIEGLEGRFEVWRQNLGLESSSEVLRANLKQGGLI